MFVARDGHRSPILASWKYGAGRTLAMTTDASGRWSGEWVRDGIFGPIWDKVISWMTPPSAAPATAKFAVALGYRAGRITVNLTDYSANGSGASRPLDALVTAPDGTRFDAILTQQAAGELSGKIGRAHV